tara:strand:- start:11797 stop:13272 length:1476 start_codon:yes stop_codon:yes gene_type:complete
MITFVEAKMNQQLFNVKKSSLVLLSLLAGNSIATAENLQINWTDNSINEDGFMIEKRFIENDAFELLSTLPANTNTYTDSDTVLDQTYCYRVVAYNEAGQTPSPESCFLASATIEPATPEEPIEQEDSSTPVDPIYTATTISISHEFTNQPIDIEIGGKELYSFKSDTVYNEDYSVDGVYNTKFVVDKGTVNYREHDYFSFQQQGVELSNGYANMAFNTGNNLSFDLKGNGEKQTATLYMKAGAWSNDVSSIIVNVGDKIENIALPKGYIWHYFTVTIDFDGSAPVSITTDSDRGSYSKVIFAGIVLNQATSAAVVEDVAEVEAVKYASIVSVDEGVSTSIDVTDLKFMTHNNQTGNNDSSEAVVELLTYYGDNSISTKRYNFINDNGENFSGYKKLKWNEDNGVVVKLKSGDSQINTASLYFTVGAWTRDVAEVEILVNGKSELVELSSGYSWKSIKVDIEFEGELDLDIHPVGLLSSYSAFKFAGLTIN